MHNVIIQIKSNEVESIVDLYTTQQTGQLSISKNESSRHKVTVDSEMQVRKVYKAGEMSSSQSKKLISKHDIESVNLYKNNQTLVPNGGEAKDRILNHQLYNLV